ncbi:hypothetical protein ILUMI_16928 [Ignelater luminosus]|uniref:Uncharacterized protein n=1 Tax=Ignelater luminosus TaxID=2038154 RepID=A0A8K0G2D7_IGNLU|nr:hypothetical protein ILUMI_16928 [Ignelater luminosus]
MKGTSERKFPKGHVGNTIKIRVSKFDRGKSDSKNILEGILEVDDENDLYEIGIKEGRLAQKYYRNQFNICQENFLLDDQVPDVIVSSVNVPGSCQL